MYIFKACDVPTAVVLTESDDTDVQSCRTHVAKPVKGSVTIPKLDAPVAELSP